MTLSPVWIKEKQKAESRARNALFVYLAVFALVAYASIVVLSVVN